MGQPTSKSRKWIVIVVASILLLPALVFWIWSAATLGYSYSQGERAGYLQKLSHKGWVCKTWEGELAMQNLPGTPPEVFPFSIRDKAVAKRLQSMEGQRVSLSYEQHKGVPSHCFGETEYFVTAVRKIVP